MRQQNLKVKDSEKIKVNKEKDITYEKKTNKKLNERIYTYTKKIYSNP